MAEISKTPKKGLSLPEHYDPSVEKLRENMALIDALLQKANPNDLSSITDSNAESNINTLTTTGRYLVKSNATGYPISGYAGVVDVFRAGAYILQEWRSINVPTYEFRRFSSNSGSSWGSWLKDWNAYNDGSNSGLDADLLDGYQLSSLYRKDYTASNFNSATSEGKYRITNETNAPYTGCYDWICLVYHLSGGANELYQIAMPDYSQVSSTITGGSGLTYSNSIPMVFVRKRYNGGWYSWQSLWNSGNDGAGSGLNADKLDDKHASDFVSSVKSTTNTDIDNITSEGMYEYTNITSTKGLPTFTGDGATYGLIVKSVKGNSGFNCCFQILLKDGCSYIYMRYYHGGSWGSWENLNSTPSQLLTKIKTVDGSGSGLDADTLDGKDSSYFSPLNEINIHDMSDLDTIIAPDDSTKTYRVTYYSNSEDGRSSYNSAFMLIVSTETGASPAGLSWKYVQTIINMNGSITTRYKYLDGAYDFEDVAWKEWSTIITNTNLNYRIKQIDGSGSGIDADLLDGKHATAFAQTDTTSYTDFNSIPVVVGMYGVSGTASNSPVSSTGVYTVIVTKTSTGYMMLAINTVDSNIYRRHTTGAWSESTAWVTIGGTGLQQATVTCVDSSNAESTTSYYLRVSRADTSTALKSGDVLSITMTNASTYSGSLCYVRYVDSTTSVSKYLYNANGSSQVPISQLPKYFLMRYDGTNFEILTPLNQTVTISTSDPTSETTGKYGDVWYTY